MSKLFEAMERATNKALTENGALSNRSTLNNVLDLFAIGGAVRGHSYDEVQDLFAKAFAEDQLLALKTIFYLRDIRGGQGERKTFRRAMRYLAQYYPNVIRMNLDNFAHYGRWDDLLQLDQTQVWDEVVLVIKAQLDTDLYNWSQREGAEVSLLAKWLPSINTSSRSSKALAKKLCKELEYSYKDYRKMLSTLRSHIKIVEKQMCGREFGQIKYETVPSQAMLRYNSAFKNRDGKRYSRYLEDVKSGKKEIKAGTLYPAQIVGKIRNCQRMDGTGLENVDQLWNALPNYLEDNPHKGLCVVDVSSSMTCSYNNPSGVAPMDVAISSGLYIAERNKCPVFGNKFITFSGTPSLQRVEGEDIIGKVHHLEEADWCMNTDLQATFDLILDEAVTHRLTNNDLPDTLYIISDMEFDEATGCRHGVSTNLEVIQSKYEKAGYIMPKIVFWNVDAKNQQVPVTIDDRGVCMVSGYSPAILQSLLRGDIESPMQVLLDTVSVERYDRVVV